MDNSKLFYIATRFGFVVDDNGHCESDIRRAKPFTNWLEADSKAKAHMERGVYRYYAILSN